MGSDGEIVFFDGLEHTVLKGGYTKITKSRFSVGDDVTSPYSKKFDFGRIVHKRSITKNNHVFWEYAVLIHEHKRQGVFYYPEAVLILLKKPERKVKVAPTKPMKRRLETTAVAVVSPKIDRFNDVMKQRLTYASAATGLIILYALI